MKIYRNLEIKDLKVGKVYLEVIKNWNDLLPGKYDKNDINNYSVLRQGILIGKKDNKKIIVSFSFDAKGDIYQYSKSYQIKKQIGNYIETTIKETNININCYALKDISLIDTYPQYKGIEVKYNGHFSFRVNGSGELLWCPDTSAYNRYTSPVETLDNMIEEVLKIFEDIKNKKVSEKIKYIELCQYTDKITGKLNQIKGIPNSYICAKRMDFSKPMYYKFIKEVK